MRIIGERLSRAKPSITLTSRSAETACQVSGKVRLRAKGVSVSSSHNKGVLKGEGHFSHDGGQWRWPVASGCAKNAISTERRESFRSRETSKITKLLAEGHKIIACALLSSGPERASIK